MSYRTENEFHNFDFSEAQIGDLQVLSDVFDFCLDNVYILPDNSANRDIRTMRCNGLVVRLSGAKIISFVKEGYRTYDADGKLVREDPDTPLSPDPAKIKELMPEAYVVRFEKTERGYELDFDGNDEATYDLVLEAEGDTEEWNRFLNM